MIALYIILGIAFLVFILLFSDVSFVLKYDKEFSFRVKYLFLSLDAEKISKLIPQKETEHKEIEEVKKKYKSQKGVIELIVYIVDIIKAALREFLRYAKLKICYINVSIATDDAAKTALVYGAVSGVIYTVLEFFDTFLMINKNYKKISVIPDFSSETSTANVKIILKLKPIHALLALMHLSPVLVKERK